jgi:hypothetical protein
VCKLFHASFASGKADIYESVERTLSEKGSALLATEVKGIKTSDS